MQAFERTDQSAAASGPILSWKSIVAFIFIVVFMIIIKTKKALKTTFNDLFSSENCMSLANFVQKINEFFKKYDFLLLSQGSDESYFQDST